MPTIRHSVDDDENKNEQNSSVRPSLVMALLLALLRFARVGAAQLDRQLRALCLPNKLAVLLLPERRITS